MQAASYSRRSKDLDHLGKNVEAQERDNVNRAQSNGHTIPDSLRYVDNDCSASRFARKTRTEWKQLLAQVEAGNVNNIYTLVMDRLLRLPRELEQLIDLALAGKFQCIITDTMQLDLRTPEGQQFARQMVASADAEVQRLSYRVKRQFAEHRKEGKATGAVIVFGFYGTRHGAANDDGTQVYEPEAVLLREAAASVLAGVSLGSIARTWNKLNVPQPLALHRHVKEGGTADTLAPSKWMASHISRMLIMPRMAGFQVHNGAIIGSGHAAVLDEATWRKVVAHFENRKRGARNTRKSGWTGAVRCECGAFMRFNPAKDKRGAALKCPGMQPGVDGCGRNSVLVKHVAPLAYAWLQSLVDNKQLTTLVEAYDDNTEALFTQLRDAQQHREAINSLFGARKMNAKDYAQALEANDVEVAALSKELTMVGARDAMLPFIGSGTLLGNVLASGELNDDEHRALFLSTGQYVWIRQPAKRGNVFDSARVGFGATAEEAFTQAARAA